ncbi:MAG: sensor histidine kinase [Desulfuromonadaceae bacterium]|nr:sensor histidine kinase [Desulfuromonadaceae bacterium]
MAAGIMSIKARYIVSGLLISLASLSVVTAASYYVSHSIVSRQLDMRMQAMADRNASELNLWFNNYKQLIECTASDIETTQSYDPETLKKIFAEKVRLSQKNIKAFYLGAAEENRIYIAPEWAPPPSFHVQMRPWFKDAVAAGTRVIITKPFEDAVLNSDQSTDFIVTIAKAVYRGERGFGVLAADISLKDMTRTVRNFSFGQNSYAFLLDSDGNIITHPNKDFLASKSGLKNIGSVPGVEYSKLIKAVGDKNLTAQSLRVKDYDGVNRNFVLSKISSSGWILGIATDEAEYSKPLSMLFYGFAVAMLISLLIGIGVMLRLVKGMTYPIQLLHDAVKSFSSNDMNARIDLNRNDELGELAASFNQMGDTIQKRTSELQELNKKLVKLDSAKSDFLSTVSHELRTPLTSVMGFAKIIKKKQEEVIFPALTSDDPKVVKSVVQVRDNLNIIVSESERLTALITDVLDIAKMDSGKIEWKSEPVAPTDIINRATAATSSLFDKKRIALLKDIDPDLPMLVGDGDRFMQVMINLLSNAVKFTDVGSVTCRAKRSPQGVLISVIDSGAGIAPEHHEAVFEKFRQIGDILSDKPQGTGLGLPICKEIVEHHGGRIWVESELGKGSTFIFEIPVAG